MIYPKERHAPAYQAEAELTCDYGCHPLAFFGLAGENAHFLAPGGAGLVNYRRVGTVAVVLGDPVCSPEDCEQVTWNFLEYCALHQWHAAFYQVSPAFLATSRTLKLRAFKMGEEAILPLPTFHLRGSALANVRTSSRRAEREGVSISWYEGVPPEAVRQQLEHISGAWLEHKAGRQASETGFSTGRVDELVNTAERAETLATVALSSPLSSRSAPRYVTAVATTRAGIACAFVTFTPIYGALTAEATALGSQSRTHRWGWSLDLMRRVPEAPPGTMELLLVGAIERFGSCGGQELSLGMVAMADSRLEMPTGQRLLASGISERLGLFESRRTLFRFKEKFHPCWESRYLVANSTLAMPKIALAVLRLRNYSGGRVVRLIK